MLAEAAGVKSPPPQTPAKRIAAPSRGLLERAKGWLLFTAIDGRNESRARANAPFAPRNPRGFVLLAMVPGILLLLATAAIFWRPIAADPDMLSSIPIDTPAQTPVERKLIRNIALLREGIWEARLPPWSEIRSRAWRASAIPRCMPRSRRCSARSPAFGETIGDRSPPGVRARPRVPGADRRFAPRA